MKCKQIKSGFRAQGSRGSYKLSIVTRHVRGRFVCESCCRTESVKIVAKIKSNYVYCNNGSLYIIKWATVEIFKSVDLWSLRAKYYRHFLLYSLNTEKLSVNILFQAAGLCEEQRKKRQTVPLSLLRGGQSRCERSRIG